MRFNENSVKDSKAFIPKSSLAIPLLAPRYSLMYLPSLSRLIACLSRL
jgi:hypothetical protein